jgi:nitrite reductase (NO-forming)
MSLALAACTNQVTPVSQASVAAPANAAGQPQGTGSQTHLTSIQVPTKMPALHADHPMVAPPYAPRAASRTEAATVDVAIEIVEKRGQLADGVEYQYWTFGGTVPGPMIRVRAGDVVNLVLKNKEGNIFPHSIDLHAVTGPGGGGKVTQILPNQTAEFRFTALNPGVYVYHCATPSIPHHIASGMYGLIVVEPPQGLSKVDREFYVMQGDMYTTGATGEQGFQSVSMEKLFQERPDYVVFNGSMNSLMDAGAMKAKVGETVRIFFGVGGPNITSSFHVIGEVFDRVYPEGSAEALTNVQTTLVPAGGATMVEFKVDYPGTYVLVDHSLSRLMKGAAGALVVEGEANPMVFEATKAGPAGGGGH